MDETRIKHDEKILIGSNIKRIREQRKIKPKDLVLRVQLCGVDINIFSLSKIAILFRFLSILGRFGGNVKKKGRS